jgi:TPP-dependent indolepyruvate ferredoxin oxidoreductase alpha subunit
LNTAGFVSGYRGSPLGGLDQQLCAPAKQLKAADIVFQPGLNEDLAATAVWGTQQAELQGEGKYDGVFALWYGKGPGVDRSGDVFRHGNMAGTSPHGGVICLMGDDHTAESSTNAHQTEFVLVDRMMPILNPAGVQEIMDYGLHGIALSRFASVWVGIKCVKDNIESTASVDGAIDRVTIVTPDDFEMPPGGLSIRRELDFLEPGEAAAHPQARRDPGLPTRQQAQPDRHLGRPRAAHRHHHGRANPISMCARRWRTSASTRSAPTTSASACSRSPAPGRSTLRAQGVSPPASTSSWSSRRSAR